MAKEDFAWLWTDGVFSKPVTIAKVRRGLALFMMEVYGTALFFGLACSSMVNTPRIPSFTDHLDITLAVITAVAIAVWTGIHITTLLNPALTLAAVILGHMSLFRCAFLIVAQIIGGLIGVVSHFILVPDVQQNYCKAYINPMVPGWMAFLYEALISAYLCWALCALIDKRRIGVIRNIALKFAFVLVPLFLHVTRLYGTTVNPAFSIAGSIVALDFENLWIGTLAPIVGCCVWAIFYRFMFDVSIVEKSEAKTIYSVVE